MINAIGAKASMSNSALKPFEVLLGEWQTTGSHPYMLNIELKGRVSFEWWEDGAFLIMRSELENAKFPDGIAIIGSDDEASTYYMLYFDERGISRRYNVSIAKNHLKWWRLGKRPFPDIHTMIASNMVKLNA